MKAMKHWHGLPNAPSLEHSKPGWMGLWATLSNLIKLKMSLPTAEGLDYIGLKGPFTPSVDVHRETEADLEFI